MARIRVKQETADKVETLLDACLDEAIKGMTGKRSGVDLKNTLVALRNAVTMVQTLGEQARTDLVAMKAASRDVDEFRAMIGQNENFAGVVNVKALPHRKDA